MKFMIITLAFLCGETLGARLHHLKPRPHHGAAILKGAQISGMIRERTQQIDFTSAAAELKRRDDVPPEVLALLQANSSTRANPEIVKTENFSEESLAKAREFLHGLIGENLITLDNKTISCKEFESRNREIYRYILADLARLASQIDSHNSKLQDAVTCTQDMQTKIDIFKARLLDNYNEYKREEAEKDAVLTQRQNDLDVFDFLIKETKKVCVDGVLLMQNDEGMQVCTADDGPTLHFANREKQKKFQKLMAKGTRGLLKSALAAHARIAPPATFVQTQQEHQESGDAPVNKGVDIIIQHLKCGGVPEDCWKIYDSLSLEWGSYKDLVDELRAEMADDAAAQKEADEQGQIELATMVAEQQACSADVPRLQGELSLDRQLESESERDRRQVAKEKTTGLKKCEEDLDYTFQHICMFITIRNEVMNNSKLCSVDKIIDCDVGPYEEEQCRGATATYNKRLECDPGCPIHGVLASETNCGGEQRLTREILVLNNTCGYACPPREHSRKCNQFRCPINCEMSEWSGWSECSHECGGGAKMKTRSVLVKPMYGGEGCEAISVTEPCETQSCDKDCVLSSWGAWGPCSMACNGGIQQRRTSVLEKIVANGRCAAEDSSSRLQEQNCNMNACIGDEICIAVQDLIISVDSSGSVPAAMWPNVVNFTEELLKRYKAKYYAIETMRVGIIQFGNGAVEDEGIISPAFKVTSLTNNIATLKTAAAAMKHKNGFTNMAQAFSLAEELLEKQGRPEAQFAVMTISDGVPSFKFNTKEKAKELESRGIQKFMVSVSTPRSDAFELMKAMASKPWETNVVRVPAWDALQDGGGPFVQEALVKFCPASMSPSSVLDIARQGGFMLVRERGYCGGLGKTLGKRILEPQACYELAAEAKRQAFSMGRKYRIGRCSVELLSFSCATYKGWRADLENPACNASWGGAFHESRYYDWYAIQPSDCTL